MPGLQEAADLLYGVFPWLPPAFLTEVFVFQLLVIRARRHATRTRQHP